MSSINSLLNHDPTEQTRPSRASVSQENGVAKPTTYEAADALTTLATLGSGQQYAPGSARELPSPTFTQAPRRTSSFGSHVAPVEPSPPIEQPQAHSPTLDQYHHGSKSPEEQRRQSLLPRSSPAPILAPIQSLSNVLHEQLRDEPRSIQSDYGRDVSQTVSQSLGSSAEGDSGRDSTQNREPAFVRDEPTTSQIRQPESIEETTSTNAPGPPDGEQLPSPLPVIKDEPSGTPREATPHSTVVQSSERQYPTATDGMDAETLKAIEALKHDDLGLRSKRKGSVTETVASPIETKPAPAPSKKRPAPGTSAVKKKGTAALKKPSSKKRKIDTEPDTTPRSATPTSRPSKQASSKAKGSQAGTPVAESSPAPENSSQIHVSEDEAESSDDNTLYCICRKPDNHRWMIGCDGGCDDWFHGSCVNMVQSDEDLVDKFICPNCEAAGRGRTSWKPMCRRDGCRRPARLDKGKESKYCSEDCGIQFFQAQLQRTAGAKKTSTKKSKKKGTKDGEVASDDDEEPTPLGGVIRAKDLKALAVASKDVETFKRLGSGVLSPPHTASPTKATFSNPSSPLSDLPFTPSEREHLNALRTEKCHLKEKLEVLKDREKFVSMAREQAIRRAEIDKIKPKEFCGYDTRLSWSDAEFLAWRHSRLGQAAFKFNTLAPTTEQLAALDADGDVLMNGVGAAVSEKETVCAKKRCPKHPQWQKLNLQDARFEELEIVEAIKECEKSERSVRERARRRAQKDVVAAELMGGEKLDERNREGWAQVVQA